jgi:hypothetical protein
MRCRVPDPKINYIDHYEWSHDNNLENSVRASSTDFFPVALDSRGRVKSNELVSIIMNCYYKANTMEQKIAIKSLLDRLSPDLLEEMWLPTEPTFAPMKLREFVKLLKAKL